MEIAYHASHEQFPPSKLLNYAMLAEKAGFDAIHSSDHFHPWSKRQGNSGFSFSWIAAAMQVTKLPFSMVCAPGQRYHPAIVAQAIATLGELFPGRFSIELGSGEALNEYITGDEWPSKEDRNQRLLESATVIRKLLYGEEISWEGKIKVREAKLYSLPVHKPLLFGAAISKETSGWCGSWADGLITTSGTKEDLAEKIRLFHEKAPNKPVYVQHAFSFAKTREEAIDAAYDQWRSVMLPREELASLYKTSQFDEKGEEVTRAEVEEQVPVLTSVKELLDSIGFLHELKINRVILHNINRNHEQFIEAYKNER